MRKEYTIPHHLCFPTWERDFEKEFEAMAARQGVTQTEGSPWSFRFRIAGGYRKVWHLRFFPVSETGLPRGYRALYRMASETDEAFLKKCLKHYVGFKDILAKNKEDACAEEDRREKSNEAARLFMSRLPSVRHVHSQAKNLTPEGPSYVEVTVFCPREHADAVLNALRGILGDG